MLIIIFLAWAQNWSNDEKHNILNPLFNYQFQEKGKGIIHDNYNLPKQIQINNHCMAIEEAWCETACMVIN